MRLYVDTGIFIDYLISRGPTGASLRQTHRRGRDPRQLAVDAEECLGRIQRGHESFTSALTFYEAEEALFRELSRANPGVAHAQRFLIPAARFATTQVLLVVDLFNIQVLDLTYHTIELQLQNLRCQQHGVRSADSLHCTMAIANDVDIIISSDEDITRLDNVFNNQRGIPIRCVDSDVALTLL